jgi:hypothetical protein
MDEWSDALACSADVGDGWQGEILVEVDGISGGEWRIAKPSLITTQAG